MSKIVQLFHCTIRSSRVVFPDGSEGAFIDGRYATDDPTKIAYLDYEISKGHPNWYRDTNLLEIDEKLLDPMEALKAKIIAEAVASGEISLTEKSSSYAPPVLTPASSANLVDVKTQEEVRIEELTGGAQIQSPSPVSDDKLANLLATVKN